MVTGTWAGIKTQQKENSTKTAALQCPVMTYPAFRGQTGLGAV